MTAGRRHSGNIEHETRGLRVHICRVLMVVVVVVAADILPSNG